MPFWNIRQDNMHLAVCYVKISSYLLRSLFYSVPSHLHAYPPAKNPTTTVWRSPYSEYLALTLMLVASPTAGRANEPGIGRAAQPDVLLTSSSHREAHRAAVRRHRCPIRGTAAGAWLYTCAKPGPKAIGLTRMALLLLRLSNILGACDQQLIGDSW